MDIPFEVTIGIYEKNANLAYFDLCGVKSYYKNRFIPNEKKAMKIFFRSLLNDFENTFSKVFEAGEIKDCFNVNIYADSIMICQRPQSQINNYFERMLDFLLSYQFLLLHQERIISRALLGRDSFFYFNVRSAPSSSILSAQTTKISLCGGRGLVSMDGMLKGLPMGVYVTKQIVKELNIDQRSRKLNVPRSGLSFIRQEAQLTRSLLCRFLPYEMLENNDFKLATKKNIECSLKKSGFKDKEIKKLVPWFSANLGIIKTIERGGKGCCNGG